MGDPPYDPCIEEGFSLFNAQLSSWMEQDPDKRLLDGHLLVKKSTTETSTGWACSKEDCPFRCVVDTKTNAITRSQWDHTHKSVVKHIIAQAMFSAVRRRAVMDYSVLPKVIYEQERKRVVGRLSGNKTLIKFIPTLTQVYQLITKTRTNPPPPPKPRVTRLKLSKQGKKKICSKTSGSNMNAGHTTGITCAGAGQFDTDYLLEQYEDEGNKATAYSEHQHQNHHQSGLMYKQDPTHILPPALLDGVYDNISYQQPVFDQTINYTNTAPSQSQLHADAFTSIQPQTSFNGFSLPNKSSQYVPLEPYLHQHEQISQPIQQQEFPPTLPAPAPQHLSPLLPLTQPSAPVQDSHSMLQIPQSVLPDSDNQFLLHGYPLTPTTASMGGIYWQCKVPGCRFQCLFNTETSQIVQMSGSHNHAPTGSQSAVSSQVSILFYISLVN